MDASETAAPVRASEPARERAPTASIEGLPPLDPRELGVSFFEFWPGYLMYAPATLLWILLGLRYRSLTLPMLANPGLPLGGLVGESKGRVLSLAGPAARELIAPFVSLAIDEAYGARGQDVATALAKMEAAGLAFPLVAKPSFGCRGAGVKVVRNEADLASYLDRFPRPALILLQTLVTHEPEAGVFYIRHPDEPRGTIPSLTLKYAPRVVGDGRSTLRELIMRDPRAGKIPHKYFPKHAGRLDDVLAPGEVRRLAFAGNHANGSIFRDGRQYVTEAMVDAFDRIAKDLPDFYFGRFDVRFPSLADLQRGENFTILEINGAGAEMIHIWDSRMTFLQAQRTLLGQYAATFRIGAANRARGHRLPPLTELLGMMGMESRLKAVYPASD